MALVEDNGAKVVYGQRCRETEGLCFGPFFEQKVAENLCGHDNDLGIGLELDVARHNANGRMGILLCQIVEFLVGQRLNGRRVEDCFAEFECSVDQIFGCQGFARSCFGSDEAIMPLVHRRNGMFLEGIKREGERNGGRIGGWLGLQIGLYKIGRHS